MSAQANQEIWQIEVGGQVYEAAFSELASWVADGGLQPDDKVRRANLRWIEARKVPSLIPHFNAKRDGKPPPPVVVTVTDAAASPETIASDAGSSPQLTQVAAVHEASPLIEQSIAVLPVSPARTADPAVCSIHTDMPSTFLCDGCGGSFCKGCPASYGGSVKICPACGGLCKPKDQVAAARQKESNFRQAVGKGFGFSDFGEAISYPFKFKTSLSFGAVLFMLFSLGRGAGAMGGIYMFVGALFCGMLANALCFGVFANTVENFSRGDIGGDFMPRFDDFSYWDDVVHPFIVSIGAYLSSFGAFLLIFFIGAYMVVSSINANQQAIMSDIEKLPGTPYYRTRDTLDQTREFNKVLGDTKKQNDNRLQQQSDIEGGAQTAPTGPADTEDGVMRANELIQKNQKAQLESALGKTPETRTKEQSEFITRFLSLAAPLVVLAAIALFWGLFYFPVACIVAGYTRSFTAAINPLVGLDTIKRLGFDYIKLLFMSFLILVAWMVAGAFLGIVFSAFDMPGVGNLPATAVGGLIFFYFSVVFSCMIGFLLFQASDKLKLYR
jgi:hypothetical protein